MIRYRVEIDYKYFIFSDGAEALAFATTARKTAMRDKGRGEIVIELVEAADAQEN